MSKEQKFDRLNWLTEQKIGKIYEVRLLGWRLTLHSTYYKNGYWYK